MATKCHAAETWILRCESVSGFLGTSHNVGKLAPLPPVLHARKIYFICIKFAQGKLIDALVMYVNYHSHDDTCGL